jgi:hypothetical protein
MVDDQQATFFDADGRHVMTYPTELVLGYSTDRRWLVAGSLVPGRKRGAGQLNAMTPVKRPAFEVVTLMQQEHDAAYQDEQQKAEQN